MPDIDPDQSFGPPGQFINPAYATPNQVAMLRALATKNLTQQPEAKSWAGVLGGLAQTWGGLQQMDRANTAEKQSLQQSQDAMVGNGGGLLGSTPMAANANAGGGGGIDPKQAVSYYTSQGLPPAAAAGLTAAFQAESGLNPNVSKVGDGRDGSPSSGIGQWNSQRGRNQVAYARSLGKSPNDPQVQLDFPLVETGLKGNPGTPGYGTEIKARQALLGAQSPKDATVAALMYERPGGYTASNPMGAYSAQKRLALTSALMGGGSGGGGQPVQMAQNAMGPFAGMSPSQAAFNTLNPWNQGNHEMVRGMYSPQFMGGPGGQGNLVVPGQGAGATNVVQGAMPNSTGTPDATVPGVTTLGPRGPTDNQFAVPGGNAGAPAGGAGGGGPLPPVVGEIVKQGQGWGANRAELAADTEAIGAAKAQGQVAQGRLGQMDAFKALGEQVDSGFVPQVESFLAGWGVPLGSNDEVGRVQAYKTMAMMLLPPGTDSDKFREQIPTLSAYPEGRRIIANFIESQYQYQKAQADIANNEGLGDQTARRKAMAKIDRPQSYPNAPSVPANSANPNQPQAPQRPPAGSAAAATSSAPIKITDEAGYKALPKGKQYIAPDGSLRTKK